MTKMIFFDGEMTSLDPFNGSIISVGAALYDEQTWEELDSFYAEYAPDPNLWIDPESMKYNKMDIDSLMKNKTFTQDKFKFYSWMDAHFPGQQINISNWSLSFDLIFLFVEAQRSGNFIPLFSKRSYDVKAMALGSKIKFRNMPDLNKKLGGGEYQMHNALADARTAAFIYQKLTQ